MFYCGGCATSRGWPETAFRSLGTCECCGATATCSERPSKDLPVSLPDGAPEQLRLLPVDTRTGHRIPWSAARLDNGRPDFTTVAHDRARQAARERRCGLDGNDLGYWLAFVGTRATADIGTFHDPPMHVGCARASLLMCPHIAGGHPVMSLALDARHQVTEWVVWITRSYRHAVVGGRVTFAPAPAKTLETYQYTADGDLLLVR